MGAPAAGAAGVGYHCDDRRVRILVTDTLTTPLPSRRALRLWIAAATLSLALAFGLRLFQLDVQSLGNDEILSMRTVEARSIGEMLTATEALRDHPPLYFLVLRGWAGAAGRSDYAGRLLSVAFGLLTVALIGAALKQGGGISLGGLGLVLAAVAPFLIYFAQEARMYAPAGAAVALALVAVVRLVRAPSNRDFALFGGACLLGFYLDLTTAPALLFLAIALLIRFRRDPRSVAKLVAAGGAALILYLPWTLFQPAFESVYAGAAGTTELGEALGLAVPALVAGGTLAGQWVTPAAAVILLLAGLAMLLPVGRPSLRWILPLVVVGAVAAPIVLSQTGLGFAQRHIYPVAPVAVAFLAVAMVAAYRFPGPLGIAGLVVVAAMVVSNASYFTDPRQQRPDFRAAARFLEERMRPGDRLLYNAPWAEQPISYYLRGERVSEGMPPDVAAEREAAVAQLERLDSVRGRLWLVEWQQWFSDGERFVNGWMLDNAARFDRYDAPFVSIGGFITGDPVLAELPDGIEPRDAVFGDVIRLAGSTLDQSELSRGWLFVDLYWESLAPAGDDYKVFAQLIDESGAVWAQTDREPVAGSLPTSEWRPGQIVADPYEIRIPPGTPPGAYGLIAGLYQAESGQRLGTPALDGGMIGVVNIGPPEKTTAPEALPAGRQLDFRTGGLRLVGFEPPSEGGQSLLQGDQVTALLGWTAMTERPAGAPELVLVGSDGGIAARSPASPGGGYPASAWRRGESMMDRARLRIPANTAPGRYQLAVAGGGARVELFSVTVEEVERSFALPAIETAVGAMFGEVAELVGVDPNQSDGVAPRGTIDLTLVWRAVGAPNRDYSVFVHLVDRDGRIRGQSDGPPDGGLQPTGRWIAGQVVVDRRHFSVSNEALPGVHRLIAGLYDPITGARVATTAGEDAVEIGRIVVR